MTEWDGRPPSGARAPSVHILRPKTGRVDCAALWSGHEWLHTWGDFGPSHAAKFYEYVGPCLTPDEVASLKVERDLLRSALERIAQLLAGAEPAMGRGKPADGFRRGCIEGDDQ